MGYTHYWHHRRRFTNTEWDEVMLDLNRIAAQARAEGVALADGAGEMELSPYGSGDEPRRFLPDCSDCEAKPGRAVFLNGLGDDSHETFCIYQNRRPLDEWQTPDRRGWDFCKTARKPYDVVVTAILCYLETCWDNRFEVSSDGDDTDWEAGLELARRALPTKANILNIPFDVRWESQWRGGFYGHRYDIREHITGVLCVLKGRDVLGYFPEQFNQKVVTALDEVPRNGFGDDIAKKTDRIIRNLLTYPEMVHGDP